MWFWSVHRWIRLCHTAYSGVPVCPCVLSCCRFCSLRKQPQDRVLDFPVRRWLLMSFTVPQTQRQVHQLLRDPGLFHARAITSRRSNLSPKLIRVVVFVQSG